MKSVQILLFLSFIYTQTTIDGQPKSLSHEMKNPTTQIVMPNFDVDQLLIEDQNYRSGKPFRYGNIFEVEYNLNNSGTWEILDDGSKLWRLEIKSEGAYAIGIEYDYFHLPVNSEFYVYSSNKENIYGAYSHHNNQICDPRHDPPRS